MDIYETLKNFEFMDEPDLMEDLDREFVHGLKGDEDSTTLVNIISTYKEPLHRIHLLCLLARPKDEKLIQALTKEATVATDYIDLATAIAGLRLCHFTEDPSLLKQLTQLLPSPDESRAQNEVEERYFYYFHLKE